MNYFVNIKCPYYESSSLNSQREASITCQNIEPHLGFEVKNKLIFKNHQEQMDYAGLFCEDRYTACPYFKGIYKREEKENEKKEKLNGASKISRAEGTGR